MRVLLTVADVAQRVGLSDKAVRRAIQRGELRASKLCGRVRIEPAAVDDWIANAEIAPPATLRRNAGGAGHLRTILDREGIA